MSTDLPASLSAKVVIWAVVGGQEGPGGGRGDRAEGGTGPGGVDGRVPGEGEGTGPRVGPGRAGWAGGSGGGRGDRAGTRWIVPDTNLRPRRCQDSISVLDDTKLKARSGVFLRDAENEFLKKNCVGNLCLAELANLEIPTAVLQATGPSINQFHPGAY